MEQALGVEMQHQYTSESSQKYSGGDLSHSQDEKKGHSGGPVSKKGKFQRHHPYRGKSAESSASGGGAPKHRTIPKPGMGLVCFRCGEAHRCVECQWCGNVLFPTRITRMWCVERIQTGRLSGSY
jgi:hypothetical protein